MLDGHVATLVPPNEPSGTAVPRSGPSFITKEFRAPTRKDSQCARQRVRRSPQRSLWHDDCCAPPVMSPSLMARIGSLLAATAASPQSAPPRLWTETAAVESDALPALERAVGERR